MNEDMIVKFLAEIVDWRMKFVEFDPINDIRHAWMVENAIAKMHYTKKNKYVWELEKLVRRENGIFGLFKIAHAAPKTRCIAATRALATDEQVEGFGL